MLTLAFDTATSAATSALLRDGELVGERVSRAVSVLSDAAELLAEAGEEAAGLGALVVGTGPGSFTGVRIGIAAARALSFALEAPLAGVSTLDALAAGAPGALPVVDAGRKEVFTLIEGAAAAARPQELLLAAGTVCVGDGALRYRELLEAAGAAVPPRESELHLPRARFHALLAVDFGEPDRVEPIYLRPPDARQSR